METNIMSKVDSKRVHGVRTLAAAAAVGIGIIGVSTGSAAITYTSNAADGQIAFTNPASGQNGGGTVQNTGSSSFSGGRATSGSNSIYYNTVYVFQLPNLGAVANPFTSTSFSMTIAATNDIDAFDSGVRYDLYGLGARSTAAVAGGDFYVGGQDTTDATRIADDFITGSNTTRFQSNITKATTNNTTLASYLNTQYNAGAGAGSYVFLRLNVDRLHGSLTGISNYASEASNASYKPQLSVQMAPSLTAAAVTGYTQAKLNGTSTNAAITLTAGNYQPTAVDITDTAAGFVAINGQGAQSASDANTFVLLDVEGYTTATGGTLNQLLTFLQSRASAYGYTVSNLTGNTYSGITNAAAPGWASGLSGSNDYELLLDFTRAGNLSSAQSFSFDFAPYSGIVVDRIAAVPEPGVAGIAGLAGLILLPRRRGARTA